MQSALSKRGARSLLAMTVGAVVVVVFFTWFFGSIFSLVMAVLVGLLGSRAPDVEPLQYVGYVVVGAVAIWAYLKTLGKWWSDLPQGEEGRTFVGNETVHDAVGRGGSSKMQKLASAFGSANAQCENKSVSLPENPEENSSIDDASGEITFHCPNCGRESRVQRSKMY